MFNITSIDNRDTNQPKNGWLFTLNNEDWIMKKLLTRIALLCFSVAANADM